MKKLTMTLLTTAMILGCCACGGDKDTSAGESAPSVAAPVESSAPASTPAESTPAESTEPEETLPGYDLTKEAVIYDSNNIKITANPIEFDSSFSQWRTEFVVENNNDFDIAIDMYDIIMNGYGFSSHQVMSPIAAKETKSFEKGLCSRFTEITAPAYATMSLKITNKTEKTELDDLGEVFFRLENYGTEEPDKDTSLPLFENDKINLYLQPDFDRELSGISAKVFGVVTDKAETCIYVYCTNPCVNGNPNELEGCVTKEEFLENVRGVMDLYSNFGIIGKYGVESVSDVNSLSFDLEIMEGAQNQLGNFHVELKVEGTSISIESMEPIGDAE